MERYQSIFMESFISDLKDSLIKITMIFKDKGIRFTVIGGASLSKYGYARMTEDIDLLVHKDDRSKIKDLPIGYIRELSNGSAKVFSLHEPKTKIEIIYSGERAGDSRGIEYIDPSKISVEEDGIPYIDLKSLIMYKLCAGIYGKRLKDFADVQELIVRNKLKRNFADKFRSDLKQKYIEIFDLV